MKTDSDGPRTEPDEGLPKIMSGHEWRELSARSRLRINSCFNDLVNERDGLRAENKELKEEVAHQTQLYISTRLRETELAARVAELEAERDETRAGVKELYARVARLKATLEGETNAN